MEISDELGIIIFITWMCLGTPLIMIFMFALIQRRLNALQKYATAAKYKFSGSDYRYHIADELKKSQFQLTQRRSSGHASKLFEIPYQYGKMLIFEYTSGSGKGSITYRVAMIESADLPDLYFHIQQHRLGQRMASRIGFNDKDIDFEQYSTFSKRYYLQGNDEIGIRDIFNHEVIEWFEEVSSKYIVECGSGKLLIYDMDELIGRGINAKVVERLKHDSEQLYSILRTNKIYVSIAKEKKSR